MTHREARQLGLWMGVVDVTWIDCEGDWREQQFNDIVDANRYADFLVALEQVRAGTCLCVHRNWREKIRQTSIA